ncbi:lytic transglycosylase domain-containing protein [Paracoccaceae bacterium GXU_MW_L88]
MKSSKLTLIALVLTLATAGIAEAQSRISSTANMLISGRLATQYNSKRAELVPGATNTMTVPPAVIRGGSNNAYVQMARASAQRYGIPESIFLRLVQAESAFNPRARSHVGAMGLAQLMPGTARMLGVSNPWDPQQNLNGGAKYLAMQYNTFRDWRLALAAYNAGPQNVIKYGGVPPFRETQNYVVKILGR